MRKEELDDHSPGPSPDDVIIGPDNKFVTTWLQEMGQNFNISQRSWWQQNLKGGIFNNLAGIQFSIPWVIRLSREQSRNHRELWPQDPSEQAKQETGSFLLCQLCMPSLLERAEMGEHLIGFFF